MIKNNVVKTLLILSLIGNLSAGEVDSLLHPLEDSLLVHQSQETQEKKNLTWIWKDIRGKSLAYQDRSDFEYITYSDHQYHNLTGLGDYFQNSNRYFLYDFIDSASPRYISGTNLLPHQTGISLDGVLLNDPINGMVNLREISTDIVRSIELDELPAQRSAGISTLSNGLNLNRFNYQNKQPMTRLKYMEGDFGYSDLDITFAKPINDEWAIELGGYNRDYQISGLNAANYRSSIFRKWKSGTQNILHFQKHQTQTIFTDYQAQDRYRYKNIKHYLHNNLIIPADDSVEECWNFDLIYKHDRRGIDASADTSILSRYRYYQYQVNAERNLYLGTWELRANSFVSHETVWGNTFDGKYYDSQLGGRIHLDIPGGRIFSLNPAVSYLWKTGESFQFLPAIDVAAGNEIFRINSTLYQDIRYPTRLERNVILAGLQGNTKLANEKLNQISVQLYYQPFKSVSIETGVNHNTLENEVLIQENSFINGQKRSFTQFRGEVEGTIWKLRLKTGGQFTNADINIAPESSFWLWGNYYDKWLYGRIGINLSGGIRWQDSANDLLYHQGLERFYWLETKRDSYYTLFYKFAATVKDAVLYFEMDNALSAEYSIVKGYNESIRRIRFGVNWRMWD